VVRAKNVVRQGRLARDVHNPLHYGTIWQNVDADLRPTTRTGVSEHPSDNQRKDRIVA
jgi:hypothetical protein